MYFKELDELFNKEVVERDEEVDPEQEEDWTSLAIGWAIGKGLTPEQAREFVLWNPDL